MKKKIFLSLLIFVGLFMITGCDENSNDTKSDKFTISDAVGNYENVGLLMNNNVTYVLNDDNTFDQTANISSLTFKGLFDVNEKGSIILNKNKNVIYEKILYHGDDNPIPINYRDILRLLLIHNGYYFYLVHNHPNGSFFPSEADESLTKKIVAKARSLGATLLDHIIISQSVYYSFLHENLLKQFKKEENI